MTAKDTAILTKVDGNTKAIGELGSKLTDLTANDDEILSKVDGNAKTNGEFETKLVSFVTYLQQLLDYAVVI